MGLGQLSCFSGTFVIATANAREFFDKSQVTKGMGTPLNWGPRRLGGMSNETVDELKQSMGGGDEPPSEVSVSNMLTLTGERD